MTSAFFGLDLALRALQAQQLGLDVTNHNIANASTEGFSRQAVELVTTEPFATPGFSAGAGAGQIGTGVIANSVLRMRDTLLDLQYRIESGTLAEATVTRDALEEVEAVFNEPSDSGLAQLLQGFFGSWQDLTSNPTDSATRSTVLAQATALANAFNHASVSLTAIQNDLNGQVSLGVTEINSATSQILALNKQIVQVEGTGQRANDLRDRRDVLLDELSKKFAISVTENPPGDVTVTVGGHALVSVSSAETLTTTATGPGGMLQVRFASDSALVSLTSGELKALTDARDTNVPGYRTSLDTIASNLITAVNALHTTGYGLDGVTGRAFFSGSSAATMAVNGVIAADPLKVAAASAAGQAGNSAIALAIAQLQSTMSPTTQSAYGGLISTLGVDTRSARDQVNTREALVRLLERRRQNVSGVSLDEEAVNMVRYQRAYEAAARVLTAYDELLDTLINRTGVVGR